MDVEITADDFLNCIPPKIEFSPTNAKKRESKSSGPRAHPKDPASVIPWDDFLSNAKSFRIESSVSLSPPAFTNYESKVSDEGILHGRIEANILNPINKLLNVLGNGFLFTGRSEIERPVLKGWPDHVLHKNQQLRTFIETKTIWDLQTPLNEETIIQWWDEDVLAHSSGILRQNRRPSIFHIIGQVYGYLSNHSLKYGMLINGEVVWYLCRPNLSNAPSTLWISPPISLVGQSPSLFRSIMYFISLVNDGHISGESPESSPTGSFPQTTFTFKASGRSVPDLPADLDLSKFNKLIGQGFSGNVVELIMPDNTVVALKCCDSNNNRDGLRMMKNEVNIYKKLESLQGIIVPTLRFSGYNGEIFVIGTDYIEGEHPDGAELEDAMKKMKQKLAQFKVEHGDLRQTNILKDKSGKYWVFDFGHSTVID